MPLDSWPYVNQAINANQYSWLHRQFNNLDGIAGGYGAPDFAVSADSTGLVVKVNAGQALIRGYMAHLTEMVEVELARADPQPRIDRVILRLDVAAPQHADRVTLTVLKGAPDALTPEPPPTTRTDVGVCEIPLAQIRVGADVVTIAQEDVTDERPYVGTTYGAWTTETRPPDPWLGQGGFNASTGRSERWNGWEWQNDSTPSVPTKADLDVRFPGARSGTTAWVEAEEEKGSYVKVGPLWWLVVGAPNWSTITPPKNFKGTIRYRRFGNRVRLEVDIDGAIASASTLTVCTLPAEIRPKYGIASAGRLYGGHAAATSINPNGVVWVTNQSGATRQQVSCFFDYYLD